MAVNDELIDRFLDGDASQVEIGELHDWLKDASHLEEFARRAELHADLRRSLRRRNIQSKANETCDIVQVGELDTAVARTTRSSRLRVVAIVGTLVTAACLLFAFLHWTSNPNGNSSPPLASVVSQVDALLTRDNGQWNESSLVAGEYRLQRGLLHLRFHGGVMVYVEAPARFNAVSDKRLVLHRGRLSANVPPEGIGFTVETPEAEVIDFGTEFSVEADSGTSEVHVFNGLVRVQPRADAEGEAGEAVDLRTSQAVKIEDVKERPVDIELARDKFIRNFDEPKRKYARSVKQLSPLAYYRMPIRDRGLVSEPPLHSGVVLTGQGIRPPHARGVFTGGSLRVGADSTGRGGRVDTPPPLMSGKFTLSVFLYLETRSDGCKVVTNIRGDDGNFALSLNEDGMLQAVIRDRSGNLHSVVSDRLLPRKTWRHVVMTVNGERLRIFEDGRMTASKECEMMADSGSDTIWFGTDSDQSRHWNGRIDELAIFDRELGNEVILELDQTALEEIARSE